MKITSFFLVLCLSAMQLVTFGQKAGQECFPVFDDSKTVYDVANLLDPAQEREMELKLQEVARSSSNEIAVVIVPSLCGMEKAQFATEIGHEWKLGQAKEDNGIVFLIKPKTASEKGEFFIAIGRGLEAVIPDATVYLIGQNEIIPSFKQGDMNGGIQKALDVLIALAKKEYDSTAYADRYKKGAGKNGKSAFGFIGIILCVVILILLFKYRQVRRYSLVNDIPFWVAWSLFNSRTHHHGGFWDGFTGGGGGGGFDGGGGGGFGGFGGGGDFGGGGAGGDW